MRAICKHCGEEIGLWFAGEPYAIWMHAQDDGPDAYLDCHCKCDACKPGTTLGIHDPTPANCIDGEVAEPEEEETDNKRRKPTMANNPLNSPWKVCPENPYRVRGADGRFIALFDDLKLARMVTATPQLYFALDAMLEAVNEGEAPSLDVRKLGMLAMMKAKGEGRG